MFNRLHNQPHIVRLGTVHPATDETQRLKSHLSLDMANYTSIHCGPDGRRSLCSSSCMWLQKIREAPSPGPSLSLPGHGWHGPGAGGAFVQQSSSGTLRWSSLLRNAPQLMEWDMTVTTWLSNALLWIALLLLPCVTRGIKDQPATAVYLQILIYWSIHQLSS